MPAHTRITVPQRRLPGICGKKTRLTVPSLSGSAARPCQPAARAISSPGSRRCSALTVRCTTSCPSCMGRWRLLLVVASCFGCLVVGVVSAVRWWSLELSLGVSCRGRSPSPPPRHDCRRRPCTSPAARMVNHCQRPVGSAQWRTVELPGGGQQNCPVVARCSARGLVGQWRHPLADSEPRWWPTELPGGGQVFCPWVSWSVASPPCRRWLG